MKFYKCMQLWIFIMIACTSGSYSTGISCYRCTIAPEPNKTRQICSKFDESEHFQVYCPKSTLCMKRTFHHRLVNGTIVQTSVERGCAPQRDAFQIYDKNIQNWRDKEDIVEKIYKEGCFIGEDRGGPGGPAEYCYCSYQLCNGSQTLSIQLFSIIIPSLIILIRYIIMF